jgi:hypothetical protein
MTHRLRLDCNHECHLCELADPACCQDYAVMTAEVPEIVRFCKTCGERMWHDVHVFTDGDGVSITTDLWACPRCQRVFGEPV